jgi:RecB family endonuclease NucS
MKLPLGTGWLAAFSALTLVACGGDADDSNVEPTSPSMATFDEGELRMEIETLDTGLLKGHSYVDATDGWTIAGVDISAVDERGIEWNVIEIAEEEGEKSAVEFFEVMIQELPRGDQITVTTRAIFTSDTGFRAERTVEDHWPP